MQTGCCLLERLSGGALCWAEIAAPLRQHVRILNSIGSASFFGWLRDDSVMTMSTLSKWKCASLRALCDASSTFAWNDEGGHERTRVQVQVQASWVQAGDKKDFFRA